MLRKLEAAVSLLRSIKWAIILKVAEFFTASHRSLDRFSVERLIKCSLGLFKALLG